MSSAKPPARRVTLRDVAARLGVSPATVSNAYNRPDQLSPELRERVLHAAGELGYGGPDPLARSLRRGRSGVIGVVYDSPLHFAFADPAASLFLGSMARLLQEQDLRLLLLAGGRETSHHQGTHNPLAGASVDGLVFYSAPLGGGTLAALRARHLPAVLVDQAPQAGFPLVGIEDEAGAYAAARHLLDLGHRELGVLALPLRTGKTPYVQIEARMKGYRRALDDAALQGMAAQLHTAEASNTCEAGEEQTRGLLRDHPAITALLCMSDVLAQGALRAAAGLGLRVPGDLSVVGYDDVPSSAALNLSTVYQPTAEKGLEAGRALLHLLAGERPPSVTLPTRLIVRGSTAPVGTES